MDSFSLSLSILLCVRDVPKNARRNLSYVNGCMRWKERYSRNFFSVWLELFSYLASFIYNLSHGWSVKPSSLLKRPASFRSSLLARPFDRSGLFSGGPWPSFYIQLAPEKGRQKPPENASFFSRLPDPLFSVLVDWVWWKGRLQRHILLSLSPKAVLFRLLVTLDLGQWLEKKTMASVFHQKSSGSSSEGQKRLHLGQSAGFFILVQLWFWTMPAPHLPHVHWSCKGWHVFR